MPRCALDPACGSGNFLYVALKRLLDLEKEVSVFAATNGLSGFFPQANPAQLYGLRDRGRLAPGNWADIVIFDPAKVDAGPLRTVTDLPANGSRLLTLFNNHLKSQFVPFDQDPVAGKEANDTRRRRQAETVERIVAARTRPDSRFLVLGDLNDTPDAPPWPPSPPPSSLGWSTASPSRPRPARPRPTFPPPPASGAWTHRFKEAGQPARYELFDQIWLSPALAARQTGGFIDRRTRHGGDGSDHDPAWVTFTL